MDLVVTGFQALGSGSAGASGEGRQRPHGVVQGCFRQLWRTLKHELAHLVAYERNMRRRIEPHGIEWQVACADLGIAGEQPFHTLPFKRRRVKRNHAYTCPNCFSTIRRVKPIQRAVACYDCCRKFNHGAYHDRFRLIKNKPVA